MGPRIREDNGGGVFTRAGFSREERRGELRVKEGEDDEIPRLRCGSE